MTTQASDRVLYRGDEYSLADESGKGLFEPKRYGLKTVSLSSACRRGYIAEYTVAEKALTLTGLEVGLRKPGPELFGTRPSADEPNGPFRAVHYTGLNAPLPYTGSLLIGRDHIWDLHHYIHFWPEWAYREVHELTFDGGRLTSARDVSEEMARRREERMAGIPDPSWSRFRARGWRSLVRGYTERPPE